MTICPLADLPQAIPILAAWFHNEWSSFDGRSTKMIEAQLAENLSRDWIPITFLALQQSTVIGTVSLDLSVYCFHWRLTIARWRLTFQRHGNLSEHFGGVATWILALDS